MVSVKFLVPSSKRRPWDVFKSPSLKREVNFLFTAKGKHAELLLGWIGVGVLPRGQIHLGAKEGYISTPEASV